MTPRQFQPSRTIPKTTRQQIEVKTSPEVCRGCHGISFGEPGEFDVLKA